MLGKLKNVMFYVGLDRESFYRVLPMVNKSNRTMVTLFSGTATIFTAIMCVLSFCLNGITNNRPVYIAGTIVSLLIFIASKTLTKRFAWLVTPLMYIVFSLFMLFGIFIGTITNPEQQTVTFIAMLIFVPVLFIDRPIHTLAAISTYVLVFIILCFMNKTGKTMSTDIMDAIIYGSLGMVSSIIVDRVKIKNFILEMKLEDVSRFDQLTQLNNRNSYELDLDSYSIKCKHSLGCIYIDVNGLHELNNSQGHERGDEMLKFVSNQIKTFFSSDCSYRIGGDEFIVFTVDEDENKVKHLLAEMSHVIEKEGYHIAAGVSFQPKNSKLEIGRLISAAELKMYRAKERYYRDGAHERRRRTE